MYLCFDWSNKCGEFFRRELVKSVLTILKRNISPAKLKTNKNPHAQIYFAAKPPFISPNGNPPLEICVLFQPIRLQIFCILKELRNCILCIIRVWSFFVQCGFRQVCIFYLFFWKTSLLSFSVFFVFYLFCVSISSSYTLQNLNNLCL